MVEQRKRELVDRLAAAREDITLGKGRVKDELSISHQLKKSLQSNPLGWFAGTMGTATLLGMIGRGRGRSEKPRRRFGFVRWAFGLAFALAKPTLTKIVVTRFKDEVENRLQFGSSKSMLGAPSQK